jgi:hypothetical protein
VIARFEQSLVVPVGHVAPRRLPHYAVAGAFLALALVVAPLNYGSTRPGGASLLALLVGLSALSWIAGLIRERRQPFMRPAFLTALCALIFSLTVWTSNAVAPTPMDSFAQSHLADVVARWPHSVLSLDLSSAVMFHASLGFACWIAADLASDRFWLILFSGAIVLTGLVVAALALAQNATHATGIFWRAEGRMPGRFWGTFFHHTTAGAYLNTVWPLAAALAFAMPVLVSRRALRVAITVAAIATFFLIGAHASHVSRFPQVAALLVVPAFFFLVECVRPIRIGLFAVSALTGLILVAVFAGRTDEIAQRWSLFHAEPKTAAALPIPPVGEWPGLVRDDLLIPNRYNPSALGDRFESQSTALRAIADRPITGHGPSNWIAAASEHSRDPYLRSFYLHLQFAHQSFLHEWAEWGIGGFVSFVLLLGGGVAAAWNAMRSRATDSVRRIFAVGSAAALFAVLLQAQLDFPLQIPAVGFNAFVIAGLCWSHANPTLSLS